ncbi:hypothetical protein CALVIDRAFT_603276 [Calocera viscosa TUFC12733]|uniref:Uncharacterized protein n=1 Tax=Calocera viscosa (strain TUFC12733) TaxID=1330018 RepID=A0A167FXQ8_CALVF|nr:hypothetical protein CALVIDRAFT_603276 [Calocera viscosa TUFC12733]
MKITLFALLLFLDGLATAHAWNAAGWGLPVKETNAERLANGLNPLPPRRLYSPTRVGPPLARRSVTPVTNTIAATAVGSGSPMCWLASSSVCQPTQDLGVPFTASVGAGSSTAQDLDINSGQFTGYNLIAETATNPTQGLGTRAVDEYLARSYTGAETFPNLIIGIAVDLHTNPGDEPVYDNTHEFWYESAIWTVDSMGGITATWINPDNSSVPLFLYVLSAGGIMYTYATGNSAVLGQNGVTKVTLAFG